MMKNLSYVLIVFVAIANTSCEKSLIGIKGDGAIVSQELTLDTFKGFESDLSGNVHIEQGDTQKVIVKAQQNIINNLKTTINNNILEIDFDKNVRSHDGLDIYITRPSFTRAQLNGSGNINANNTITQEENIEIGISGSGNISIDINANEIYSNISGSGDMTINANCSYLSTQISGSGEFHLSGTATDVEHDINGSGNIKAYDLNTINTNIYNSGSSNAELSVEEYLDVDISGSGNIYYKGNPHVSIKTSGSGRLIPTN